MKKHLTTLISALIVLSLVFVSCRKDRDTAVTGVTLNQRTAELAVGQTLTLTASVLPENATNRTVTWTSSNPNVVTVVNGVLTAVSAGTATITVTSADGNRTATCAVTVSPVDDVVDTPVDVLVTGVTLNEATAELAVGDNFTLTATVLPENATNRNVTWLSNNTAVATVANGVVTAVSAGAATITVTSVDGNHTATSEITVNPASFPVTGVSLNQTSATLVVGEIFTLTAKILPENATNKNVTWSSNNTAVATVANGVVTAVSVGVATVTVTTEDGNHTATAKIDVYEILSNRCNTRIPGWGENLGIVSFHSQGHNVVISGNSITQTWSGAVTATNCQKVMFSGGIAGWGNPSNSNFNADCRSNPDFPGDLFSWCAVARFADELCPAPWRVPTDTDFVNLDFAMGGTGNSRFNLDFINSNYITRWGGAFGGRSSATGDLFDRASGNYWTSLEAGEPGGRNMFFRSDSGLINTSSNSSKGEGFTLRCVR